MVEHMLNVGDMKCTFLPSALHSSCKRLTRFNSVATGEEIVSGQIVDTNAAWLSQKLVQMGFVVKRHSAVGDNLIDLKNLLQDISLRADFCICTGGLGPTIDVLTAQAVAESLHQFLR
jgi:molybdenum cofactor synthesis domain-containing protein